MHSFHRQDDGTLVETAPIIAQSRRGRYRGPTVHCPDCPGNVRLKVGSIPPIIPAKPGGRTVLWAYGVTTVLARMKDLLPRTLASLARAGFDQPHLFVDGSEDTTLWRSEFNLPTMTFRCPTIRTAGHWVLSLYELFIRNPNADRYAIFQDDLITYPNLRGYLDRCHYPEKGYWNLYTFPSNQSLAPVDSRGRALDGWYQSNQKGRGAVGLVFSRATVITLLSSRTLVERPQDCHRGHRSIDGGIVTALAKEGWEEWVHNPSLVQHTGKVSAMANTPHLDAPSFRGEGYDAFQLVDPTVVDHAR